MKVKRLVSLLFALLMILSAISFGSAENSEKYFGYNGDYYTLANGKTASFILLNDSHSLYTSKGTVYKDVIYECEGPVSATVSSGSSWINVTNTMNSFIITFSSNYTQKARVGKITVKGDGYKATMKFTQYGVDKILSVKRSKKSITMKFKLSSGAKAHYLYIDDEARKVEDDLTWYSYSNSIYNDSFSKSSYKFTAKKNHYYYFGIGPAIPYTSGDNTYYYSNSTSWGNMYVESLTGTQNPNYLYSEGD